MNKTVHLPKIHFILPGGGVRGAFQAGFLYRFFSEYKDKFEVVKIGEPPSVSLLSIVVLWD